MQAWGIAQAQPSSGFRVCVRAVDAPLGSGRQCFVGEDTPDGIPVWVAARIYSGPVPPPVVCTTMTVRTLGGYESVKRCTPRILVPTRSAVLGDRA
jgi:hypothetical protein